LSSGNKVVIIVSFWLMVLGFRLG